MEQLRGIRTTMDNSLQSSMLVTIECYHRHKQGRLDTTAFDFPSFRLLSFAQSTTELTLSKVMKWEEQKHKNTLTEISTIIKVPFLVVSNLW